MSVTRRALPFLLLALILSHTQVVVQAQKAAVGSLPDVNAATSQEIADAVSRAFGAAVQNTTGHDAHGAGASAASSGAATDAATRASLSASSSMAQSAAADGSTTGLKLLDAYQELFNSVQVKNLGDGSNLKRLKDAAIKFQDAYAAMSGVIGPDAAADWLQRSIGVQQLLLQTVGTELGDLGLVVGLLGLAAFIVLTVGAALLTAAASLFLAVNIQGLQAAAGAPRSLDAAGAEAYPSDGTVRAFDNNTATTTNSTNSSLPWWDESWFKEAEGILDDASSNIVNWALDSSSNNALDVALGIINVTFSLLPPAPAS